jgi:hypothetical protein
MSEFTTTLRDNIKSSQRSMEAAQLVQVGVSSGSRSA